MFSQTQVFSFSQPQNTMKLQDARKQTDGKAKSSRCSTTPQMDFLRSRQKIQSSRPVGKGASKLEMEIALFCLPSA
jgi:hypothetical protein